MTAARPMKLADLDVVRADRPLAAARVGRRPRCARTFDSMPSICGAERDEEAAEILDVRLARGVADHGARRA